MAIFDCTLGRELTPEEIAARPAETIAPAVIQSVTPRQAKLALLAAGLLANVEATIDAISDATEKAAARIEWDFALEFRRDNALLNSIGAALGLTEGQIDALFEAASAL